ncbi:helix-turn-helix domain-containing protein [Myroides sp. M-43]|uniref:AraC family transcriptional regulator n=1 Tax=Myroides oncorhynchi TaxID=2893756 RepID=UPI001E3C82BC|nr:helix-turn-helix domain-containing protein [Myroides oncorhynchi]MCC9044246.1 helix-turn-helix domain-containing protein [Myroides oncorhynchi]
MRLMFVNKIAKKCLSKYMLYVLLLVFVTFCLVFYTSTIECTEFNIFPWVGSIILLSLTPTVNNRMILSELYSILILGIAVIIVHTFFHLEIWLEDSLFNFFSIMYFLFYFTRISRIAIEDKIHRGYIHFINFFLLFDFILFNVDSLLGLLFRESIALHIKYIDIGIDAVILFISCITLLSLIINKLILKKKSFTYKISSKTDLDVEEAKDQIIISQPLVIFTEEEVLIVKKIADFFEQDLSYLENDFSLSRLCELIIEDNRSTVSRVINDCLNTTFYKLVGKYRVNHSLRLLERKENWTLDVVANSCGFKSVNTFKKHFVDCVGITPNEYRMVGF